MRRVIGVAGLALVLAGCGSSGASPSTTSSDRPSPKVLLERVVVRILHQVPVPSGARYATPSEAKGITWLERPDGPNLVAEHADVRRCDVGRRSPHLVRHPPATRQHAERQQLGLGSG